MSKLSTAAFNFILCKRDFQDYFQFCLLTRVFLHCKMSAQNERRYRSMRKISVVLFSLLAVSLVLLPAPVLAISLDKDCAWEKVKWEDNKDSCFLYLDNWGKTPITAMSRLSGLAYPASLTKCVLSANPGTCFGNCAACNDEQGNLAGCTDPAVCKSSKECPGVGNCELPPADKGCNKTAIIGVAHCAGCWGVSLAFANKGWGGKASGEFIRDVASVNDKHPNHFGNSDRRSAGGGGDWGITGAPHSECKADHWALTCNLDKDSACMPVKK
jgi:hypothetical protein